MHACFDVGADDFVLRNREDCSTVGMFFGKRPFIQLADLLTAFYLLPTFLGVIENIIARARITSGWLSA